MMRADVWSWLPDDQVVRVSGGAGAWMQASIGVLTIDQVAMTELTPTR